MHEVWQVLAWTGFVTSVLAFWSMIFRIKGQRRSVTALFGQVVLFVVCSIALGGLDAMPDPNHAYLLTLVLLGSPVLVGALALFEALQRLRRMPRRSKAPNEERLTAAQIGAERRRLATERKKDFISQMKPSRAKTRWEQKLGVAQVKSEPATRPADIDAEVTTLASGMAVEAIMQYRDRSGHITERGVTIRSVFGRIEPNGDYQLTKIMGVCHVRHAVRTFNVERIVSIADAKTGEVMSDTKRALIEWSGLSD